MTITGPPGMGKTRLALELSRESASAYPEGVWLVSLAPVASGELAVAAVQSAIGAPSSAHEGGAYVNVVDRIGDRRMLLVVDNCEHLVEECAALAASLLESCSNFAILATSQEPLSVAGENVWPLAGLDLPDGAVDAEAAAAPAVQLFEQRARASDPRFSLDGSNVDAVVEICRRLDGIPLAIELAAARVATFSPAEIATRLDDRFKFLTGGRRSAMPRHRTLRAAVDWSYELLSAEEQVLLRRLSVFAGGAALDAIEQVCTGGEVEADACLDLVTTLVARSLLVVNDTPAGTRYGLLETIRFYGRDRLAEAGEASATAARHVRWCLELAQAAEPQLTGRDQREAIGRLEADHDNLRGAMAHSLDQGPTDQALRLAGSLAMFWRMSGHFREGFDWLGRVLDVSDDAPAPLRARAFWGHGLMAAMLGHWDVAGRSVAGASTLFEELGDPTGLARTLLLYGSYPGPDPADNMAALQRSIAFASQGGDPWCLSSALALCGATFDQMGHATSGVAMLNEAAAVARSSGDRQALVYALVSLGKVSVNHGDFAVAESALEEALETMGTDGFDYEKATGRLHLAVVAIGRGHYDRARSLLAEARYYADAVGSSVTTVDLPVVAGSLALGEGDLVTAEQMFIEAQAEAERLSAGSVSAAAMVGRATVALAGNQTLGAEVLLTQALEIARTTGNDVIAAEALEGMAVVLAAKGNHGVAMKTAQEAFRIALKADARPTLVRILEALAHLAMSRGRTEKAVRSFAAAHVCREKFGYNQSNQAESAIEQDLSTARARLGETRFETAWAEGTTLSLEAAGDLLNRTRRSSSDDPVTGVAALTEAERQVARLLLAGYSNREIASRLFVSFHTVKTHVSRVYRKLSVVSRADLRDRFGDHTL